MEQINLQSHNLTIHYFSFNISGSLQKDYLRKRAYYIFKSFGFNSTFKRKQLDQKETFFRVIKIHIKLFLSTMIRFQKQKVSGRVPRLILPARMPNTFIIK